MLEENLTPEQIQRHYDTALDSVDLINKIMAKPVKSSQDIETLTANAKHLEVMESKTFWTTQDISVLSAARYSTSMLTTAPQTPPKIVTMRQARLALHAAGHLSSINAAVAQMDEAAKIEWEYASTVDMGSPLVVGLAAQLGMSQGDLNNLFIMASQI